MDLKDLRRVSGFGQTEIANAYAMAPSSEAVEDVFELARREGRPIVLRGAARSYGDAAIVREGIALETSSMKRILAFDAETGLLTAEPGASLEELWKHALPQGWYLPVVSGTAKATLGGALAMNIHGKNNWKRGVLGEHIRQIEVVFPKERRVLTPSDPLFFAVIGGAGLLGVITQAQIQLKPVASGSVRVRAVSCSNWDAQFQAFETFEGDAEYVVSWIDGFASGPQAGRGLLHAAWHVEDDDPASRQLERQDLPDKILGMIPKDQVWRFLRVLNRRACMKFVNAAKHVAGKREARSVQVESLAAFNYLLDYVPGWERAYLPGGLIQCQYFLPKSEAPEVFPRLFDMQRAAKLETFLAVMKRHRPDPFLLSHSLDGYSIALDFKVTEANREGVWSLAQSMTNYVIEHGGRTYFAKDSTLTETQAKAFLGSAFDRFRELKSELDPENLLSSELGKRVGLSS